MVFLRTMVAAGLLASLAMPAAGWTQTPPVGEEKTADGSSPQNPQPAGDKLDPPELVTFVNATYPPDAMEQGIEGHVLLLVEIDQEGKVAQVTVLTGAGFGFDEAAVAAVKGFMFKPALLNGEPIPVRIQYVYHFRLEKKEVKAEEGQVIEGTLKEKGVGLPVVGAEVAMPEFNINMTTDSQGRFWFRKVPPGTYRILVSSPEYKPLEAQAEVLEGKTLELALLVEPVFSDPYETVVVGEKEEPVVAKYSLEQKTLETVPGTFGDPVRVVETLPGVARAPYGVGLLVIRGANPEDSLVTIDGVTIPLLYHFLGGPSVLNANFLDRIDYYPGNFPTRYGNATGGVVEVSTKKENVERWGGELDVNLLNISAYVEGNPGEGMSLKLGARRSYVDAVILAALEIAGESGTTVAPVYYDYQAEFDYQLDARNRVGVFAFGSYDSLELVTANEGQDLDIELATETSFLRLVGVWQYARKGLSLEFKPVFGWDLFTLASSGVSLEGNSLSAGGRFEAGIKLASFLKLTAGLDGTFVTSDFSGEVPVFKDYYIPGSTVYGSGPDRLDVREETLSSNDGNVGVYTDWKFDVTRRWSVTPGLRVGYFRYSGRNNLGLEPRLVSRLQVADWLAVKAGVGRFVQEPSFYNRTQEYGNPDLQPQWAMHYSGGLELSLWDKLMLDVTGFYVRRYDMTIQTEDQESVDGAIQAVRFKNSGEGHSYGMELILKADPAPFFYGWLSYTLSRTELWGYELYPDGTDTEADPDKKFLGSFDQTHILSAVGSFRLGRGWETGLRLRLVSGNPSTPIDEGMFLADSYAYSGVPGVYNSTRLPLFLQVDLRVEKKWTFDKWNLTAYLDIQNVTNHSNTEFIVYDYRFRESWNVPGIPFFPSLGLTGRF